MFMLLLLRSLLANQIFEEENNSYHFDRTMGIPRRFVVVLLVVLMFISLCASGRSPRQTVAGKCGKRFPGAGAIFRGARFKRGEYPWNVALLYKTPPKFFCGATLVSLLHVVTGEFFIRRLETHLIIVQGIKLKMEDSDLRCAAASKL